MRGVALAVCLVWGIGCGDNADVAPWQSGRRLRAITGTADDGFSALIGWHDTLLDTDCSNHASQDCGYAQIANAYADPDCTVPVLLASDWRARHVRVSTGRDTLLIYAIEPAELAQSYLLGNGNYCYTGPAHVHTATPLGVPVDVVSSFVLDGPPTIGWAIRQHVWSDGASEIGVDQVSTPAGRLAPEVSPGSTRLRTHEVHGRLARAFTDGLFDTVHDEACWPWRAGDGRTYCLPVSQLVADPYLSLPPRVYSDPGCSIEADALDTDEVALARDATGAVDHVLRPTGDVVTGSFYHLESCQIAQTSCCVAISTARAAVRAELSEFVELAVEIE